MIIRYKNTLEGFRFAGLAACVREIAFHEDCSVEQLIENKSWLTTKVLFEIRGEESRVERFKEKMAVAIERYNNESQT